jgi:integrase
MNMQKPINRKTSVSAQPVAVAANPLASPQSSLLGDGPVAAYLAGLAPSGRTAVVSRLNRVAALLGAGDGLRIAWAGLSGERVLEVRSRMLEDGAKPATVNATLAAVRGVAREAHRLGLMAAEDYLSLRQVKNVRGEPFASGRSLSHDEIGALMQACADDDSAAGRRDAAVIALLYAGGLRRSELAGLDLCDYSRATGELRVRSGAGCKERLVWLNGAAGGLLCEWLGRRGVQPGPLFPAMRRGGGISQRRLTPQTVRKLLRKRSLASGVGEVSPNDLRRTLISDLLEAGVDLTTVQKLAGHANVQMTARYALRQEEAKQQAVELIRLPLRTKR